MLALTDGDSLVAAASVASGSKTSTPRVCPASSDVTDEDAVAAAAAAPESVVVAAAAAAPAFVVVTAEAAAP